MQPSARPRARPGRDLLGRHRPGVGVVGILAERAVGAAVATEVGDGKEDLRRVGDRAPPVRVATAPATSSSGSVHCLVGEERDGVVTRERLARRRALERGNQLRTGSHKAAGRERPHERRL